MSREIVLVAGGAGYIGSHTVVELLNAGLLQRLIFFLLRFNCIELC